MIDSNIVVSTPTQELYNKVVQKFLDAGIIWCSGSSGLYESQWACYKEDCCVCFENNSLTYSSLLHYRERTPNYNFMSAEEFLYGSESWKNEFFISGINKSALSWYGTSTPIPRGITATPTPDSKPLTIGKRKRHYYSFD